MQKDLATMLKAGMAALVIATIGGCAILAGTDDGQGLSAGSQMRFVETFRDQESFKNGQGWRENVVSSSPTLSSLQRPNSVYVDDFKVYVTDRYKDVTTVPSARVFVFDRGSRTVTILDRAKGANLLEPSGIIVNGGIIFVADAQQGKVFGYDLRGGEPLYILGKRGELQHPAGLAFDRKRNKLYVADSHAHVVKVFDSMGMFLYDVGTSSGAGELKHPVAVALDRAGAVYVLDGRRKRVAIFDGEGHFVRSFALTSDTLAAPMKPLGIAVDPDGRVLVTDEASNNVLIYDAKGALVSTWGKTGRFSGDFWLPAGIFIDDHGMVYVADQMNGRVQEFQNVK